MYNTSFHQAVSSMHVHRDLEGVVSFFGLTKEVQELQVLLLPLCTATVQVHAPVCFTVWVHCVCVHIGACRLDGHSLLLIKSIFIAKGIDTKQTHRVANGR